MMTFGLCPINGLPLSAEHGEYIVGMIFYNIIHNGGSLTMSLRARFNIDVCQLIAPFFAELNQPVSQTAKLMTRRTDAIPLS